MSIKNCDGTMYKVNGSMTSFDPFSQEQELFNQWDAEIIQFGGSPIFYYELLIQRNTIDPLLREDRGKIYSIDPVCLYTIYDPVPSQNYMNMYGMDSPDDIKFELNYRQVLKKLGHPPKIGSRLFTPHKRENWEIIQRSLGDFKFWNEGLTLILICQRFQESTTSNDGNATQSVPKYTINGSELFTPP